MMCTYPLTFTPQSVLEAMASIPTANPTTPHSQQRALGYKGASGNVGCFVGIGSSDYEALCERHGVQVLFLVYKRPCTAD